MRRCSHVNVTRRVRWGQPLMTPMILSGSEVLAIPGQYQLRAPPSADYRAPAPRPYWLRQPEENGARANIVGKEVIIA
jgi:hypothetical protein